METTEVVSDHYPDGWNGLGPLSDTLSAPPEAFQPVAGHGTARTDSLLPPRTAQRASAAGAELGTALPAPLLRTAEGRRHLLKTVQQPEGFRCLLGIPGPFQPPAQ